MENPQSANKSQDLQNIIAADLPLAISKLNDIKSLATAVNQMVRSTINRVKNEELPMDKGMSFLDVKNHMLLKYIINLNCLLLKKISGGSIKDNSCIDRLVEIRTILERMRPVEHKLRYQIDKLLKFAVSGKLGENDPLQFKANPQNLVSKVGDDDEDDDSSEEEVKDKRDKKTNGAYVPPKLVAMQYDGDETSVQKTAKVAEKARKHALSSSALQHLREEFMDTPAEIIESSANGSKMSVARERQDRQEYEETYFTRLPYTKQDKHKSRQQYSSAALANELTGMGSMPSGNKRKSKTGGKKKGGFKKRKH